MGVFSNALPFFLLNWAQQSVASAFAGMTMASVPLFVLPLAHLFVPGERIGPVKLIGFVTGFVGVILLIGPRDLMQLEAGGWRLTLARLACVARRAAMPSDRSSRGGRRRWTGWCSGPGRFCARRW